MAALLPAGKAACVAANLALEAGYVAFKWKVGVFDDGDERAILDDLLARLPGHARLRLDANGAWTARYRADPRMKVRIFSDYRRGILKAETT